MVSTFTINSVVIHGIVRSTKDQAVEPDLSGGESVLTDRIRGFLQQQISQSLKHGRQIVEEPGLSVVPDRIRELWAGKATLLEVSVVLARTLQSTQPTQSPEGLLMVADGTTGGKRVFVVAKLEHETGAQAKREPDESGNLVYSMTFLDDLIFTSGSQVYKIGWFPIGGGGSLEGLVVDRQAAGHKVATYFREGYLGCAWKERPELVTERFMDTVQKWIDTVEDPEKRSRYQVALLSELRSQSTGLSVSGFAVHHLDVGDRDQFERHARQTLPATEIPKNLELVKARLNSVRIDTATGTIVMAQPERLRDGTVVVEPGDGTDAASRIVVTDRISKTSGTGNYRPQQD